MKGMELREMNNKAKAFYRVPKLLYDEPRYKDLSCEAKTLYMFLLDRRQLSEMNGAKWRDEQGCVFINYTIKEMMAITNYGNKKINELLKELEKYQLIKRKHRGLGRANRIYVYDVLESTGSGWKPDDDMAWLIAQYQ